MAAVQQFLQTLARAVHQFHTYPSASPLCTGAVHECHAALQSLGGRERLSFRVVGDELFVDEIGIGGGAIEHELVRRLHRAQVAAIDLNKTATFRDLSRFCTELATCPDPVRGAATLAELMAEHGVQAVTVRMAPRPEVVEVGAPSPERRQLVEHEQARRQSLFEAGGPVQHLYPPDKGWVRLDPATGPSRVSLVDLAVLLDSPAEIAAVLMLLTDEEPSGSETGEAAFEQKFADVAALFSALDPRLARVMFAKLSRAVLDLGEEQRKRLLQRTILPGLLDGRVEGSILTQFPDLELAEALCLLLDLETAAPELILTALDRLDIASERRETLLPAIEARLRSGVRPASEGNVEAGLDEYARRLLSIKQHEDRNFAEFAAFDLSIGDQTLLGVAALRMSIDEQDIDVPLRSLFNLARLHRNPDSVSSLVDVALARLGAGERNRQWSRLTDWIKRFRVLAEEIQSSRPDVAQAIYQVLTRFWTSSRVTALAELLCSGREGAAAARAVLEAVGVTIVPSLLDTLDEVGTDTRVRSLTELLCERATDFAPAVAAELGRRGTTATRAIIRVLAYAGPGYESILAETIAAGDEQIGRDALRALAQIGTARAAGAVAALLEAGPPWARSAAERALSQFPPATASPQLRRLLGRREFVLRYPDVSERLLERAVSANRDDMEPVLARLAPLRFRFWNRPIVRLARRARDLRHR